MSASPLALLSRKIRNGLSVQKYAFSHFSSTPAVAISISKKNFPVSCRNRLNSVPAKLNPPFTRFLSAQANVKLVENNTDQIEEYGQGDRLYSMIELELRGHDPAVLDSYEWFVCQAARELDINVGRTFVPLQYRYRFSLNKSIFIYGNHKVQYEYRNHFRVVQLNNLTGSTADTYLEYVQRNLPEGIAMKVMKCAIEEYPEAIDASINPPDERISSSA